MASTMDQVDTHIRKINERQDPLVSSQKTECNSLGIFWKVEMLTPSSVVPPCRFWFGGGLDIGMIPRCRACEEA